MTAANINADAAPVRVRFAPAPTGSLHVGGARTALFNWLYARHHHGTLVLRIEDTDAARSRPEWVAQIQATLSWLGLDWDEGPFLQSDRMAEYSAAIERLLAQGDAYECFETPEELAAINDAAVAAKRPPGYDGRARDLTPAQKAALASQGRPRSIRLRTPDEGTSELADLVRGSVGVEWSTVNDFVIQRSDGTPTFFLANALDDADMGITHVIRGEDLLDSTHRVLAIRMALGIPGRPQYAHLPLLVGEDRAKLSKRHGAVALEDFMERGYLPEALVNYLSLLGFSPLHDREILPLVDLISEFDLDRVTHSAAFFDYKKLDWMNGEYIRALSPSALFDRVRPVAINEISNFGGNPTDDEVLVAAVSLAQERAVTVLEIVDQAKFLFGTEESFEIAPESWEKVITTERVGELFESVIAHIEGCEWTPESIDLRPTLETIGLKPRKALPAIYAALEGRHSGLPLFDSIHLLGRERSLHRLRSASQRLK